MINDITELCHASRKFQTQQAPCWMCSRWLRPSTGEQGHGGGREEMSKEDKSRGQMKKQEERCSDNNRRVQVCESALCGADGARDQGWDGKKEEKGAIRWSFLGLPDHRRYTANNEPCMSVCVSLRWHSRADNMQESPSPLPFILLSSRSHGRTKVSDD